MSWPLRPGASSFCLRSHHGDRAMGAVVIACGRGGGGRRFSGGDFGEAVLKRCDLRGARLDGARLDGARLDEALVDGDTLDEAARGGALAHHRRRGRSDFEG